MKRAFKPYITARVNTFDRIPLLKEVVKDYEAQTYDGPKQLVIINDNPNYFYFTQKPKIKIVNFPFRFPYLKMKSNISAHYCDGEFVTWWADDDHYEPHAFEVMAKYLDPKDQYVGLYPYYKHMPVGHPRLVDSVENDMLVVRKSFWIELGGYAELEKTNYSFIRKVKKKGWYKTKRIKKDEIYFHWMCRGGRKNIWKPSPKEDYIYNPDRKPGKRIEL